MDKNRRKFLKIILFGSGALLMEKILSPLFKIFSDNSFTTSFKKFRIVEDKKKLSIYDSSGEEIFQVDDGV